MSIGDHVYHTGGWKFHDAIGWYIDGRTYIDWRAIEKDAWREFCMNPQIKPFGVPETYRGQIIV